MYRNERKSNCIICFHILEDSLNMILEMNSINFWKNRFSEISYGETVLGMSKKKRFSIFNKSMSGVRFSESARKMTQNGGRVVAI